MRNKKLILLVYILVSIFVVSIINVKAAEQVKTLAVVANKDSYVDVGDPTANFGGQDVMWAGITILSDLQEAYIEYPLTDEPENWTKAEITFETYYVGQTINVTISLVIENWDENTITWINKPSISEIITTLLITGDQEYIIDISNYVDARTHLCICINATTFLTEESFMIFGRTYSMTDWRPEIVWTYTQTVPEFAIYGYSTMFIIGLTCALGI